MPIPRGITRIPEISLEEVANVKGDRAATGKLFSVHSPLIMAIARKISAQEPCVFPDLYQEGFFAFLHCLRNWAGEGKFSSYLCSRVTGAMITYMHAHEYGPVTVSEYDHRRGYRVTYAGRPPEDIPDSEAVSVSLDLSPHIHSLPEKQRQAVTILFGLDGGGPIGVTEAGRRLGKTKNNIYANKKEAFKKLRVSLKDVNQKMRTGKNVR